MIDSVITFKWEPTPGYRSKFTSQNVNISFNMVKKHYPGLKKFICVTDKAEGLDPDIEVVDLWSDFSNLANPTWRNGPSCYRRLPIFAESFRTVAGDRFACIDLDWLATGSLAPIFDRKEPFVVWNPGNQHVEYCAAMMLMDAGYLHRCYSEFDPKTSPMHAHRLGFRGSDQGWIACWAARNKQRFATWTKADGVYGYRDHLKNGKLPDDARIVIFCGKPDPWDVDARRRSPWIEEHYQ